MLEPELIHNSNRGSPLSPAVKVCIALVMYAGGHFRRIAGLFGGVTQFAAGIALNEVNKALIRQRKEYIYMPTDMEMEETADRMWQKFHLPRFALGVDGVMLKFQEAPRNLPENKHQQQFWCRKQNYAMHRWWDIDIRFIQAIPQVRTLQIYAAV